MTIKRGIRDLDWIIDTIEYDYREDDDNVNGSWRVVRNGSNVFVLFEPYDDGSAEFEYPAKASAYVVWPIHQAEGKSAVNLFRQWTGQSQEEKE